MQKCVVSCLQEEVFCDIIEAGNHRSPSGNGKEGSMRILHTGDLHLDSAFTGESVLGAEARRERQRETLSAIFDTAKEQGCQMILIAGDLFDGRYVTPETRALCLKLFRKAECPVILAPGNHDPYGERSFYGDSELPDNVFVFTSSELGCFDFEELGARVYGYAFTSPVLAESPLAGASIPEEDGKLHLLCAHGELNAPLSRYAPLIEGDLTRMGFDYCALGHVHNPDGERLRGRIRYCGFPEGRSYDELGYGQVLIVDVEKEREPAVHSRTVSSWRYEREESDVTGVADGDELRALIRRVIDGLGEREGLHLRLSLTGYADPAVIEEVLGCRDDLGQGMSELSLRDETVPFADGAYLERDTSIRGAFYRVLYPRLIHEDSEVRRLAARALQIGLAAIDGRKIPEEERGE